MRECECVPGHRCDCWDHRPADPAEWDTAVEDVHRAFCDPEHEKVGPWDREMAEALRRRGLVIRRADAEPRLRAALEDVIRMLVAEHGHDAGTKAGAPWPECLPVHIALNRARAALTTPDTTG